MEHATKPAGELAEHTYHQARPVDGVGINIGGIRCLTTNFLIPGRPNLSYAFLQVIWTRFASRIGDGRNNHLLLVIS